MASFSKHIPLLGLGLVKLKGADLLEKVGEDAIKQVVTSILCGGNVRALTEGLTQRRITLSNAALLVAYLRASKEIPDLPNKFHGIIAQELSATRLHQDKRIFLQWFIGLTGKSVQNVLRGDGQLMENYLHQLEKAIENAVAASDSEFGQLEMSVKLDDLDYRLNWQAVIQVFTGIGAQTLAIRGSEKSMYGKLFEKLVLGSLLTLLGFRLIKESDTSDSSRVFWLSHREARRESDATLLFKPGKGIRFDIGFIGSGNTEVSLDKISRFEREMEFGRQKHQMSTIIIIDRIGSGSKIRDLAKGIDGEIVQMSMNHWVKETAMILEKRLGHRHILLEMSDEDGIKFIQSEMKKMDISQFL